MATDMQISFIDAVSRGIEPLQAATDAGYAAPAATVYQLLRSPRVVEEIARNLERSRVESGAIGLSVAREIAQQRQAPAAARMTAARTLMEWAGMIGRNGPAEKDPADMSTEELKGLLGRIDTEIATRAKPVNGPIPSPIPDQVTDLIE